MTGDVARRLIQAAIGPGDTDGPDVWADLGAGAGTFTHALAEVLGPDATIHAVERDRTSLSQVAGYRNLNPTTRPKLAHVIPHHADFTAPLLFPALSGIVMANSLHFVERTTQPAVLQRLQTMLKPRGRFVIIEYNRDRATRWVPYPVPAVALRNLAEQAGLELPVVVSTTPSAFGGEIYCAYMLRKMEIPRGQSEST